MLSMPTVLVLGAGASKAFGLPIGSELAADIRARLSFEADLELIRGDPDIIRTIQQSRPFQLQTFLEGAAKMVAALPNFKSIDDCLATHGENTEGVLAGKMAITSAIRAAERDSIIKHLWSSSRRQRDAALSALRDTWAGRLVQILVTGIPRSRYRQVFENLTIVSFNYDRCIQAVLFQLIQEALDLSAAEAADAMGSLNIVHAYGSLGPLDLGKGGVPFGSQMLDLEKAAQGLFTYTEDRDLPQELMELKNTISSHQRIVFLGFGFHRQNVELLSGGEQRVGKEIYGTVYREPGPAAEVYRARVGSLGSPISNRYPELVNVDCNDFMGHYSAVIGG